MESSTSSVSSSGGGGGGGSSATTTTTTTAAAANNNNKYQKLAAEYAKLRSQVQVLKKAVVDEQSKSESLKSTTTSQDQSIRKLEQELDSVKFRNRQLEKRIEILQEPQQQQQTGGHHGGSRSSHQQQQQQPQHPHPHHQSIDSNLLLHVEQNKVLQEQLALLNEKYSQEVGRLRRMIDHEMVPRELMESLGKENSERVTLLNRRVQELVELNGELRGRVEGFEMERCVRMEEGEDGGKGGGGRSMEVDELVKRLTESELGREKLNSEVQILRLKLKRLGGGGGSAGESGELVKSPVSESSSAVIGTALTSPIMDERVNMIGRMIIVNYDGESTATTATTTTPSYNNNDNDLLVPHLRSRISELIRLLQLSDSKAIHYYSEAVNLCRLVRTGQVTYRRLDGEFGKLKGKFRGVCDELEDTKKVYEGQVDSLTEHIALLNEKLAGVVEEVQVLKMGGGGK